MMTIGKNRTSANSRKGTAVMEAAVMLPVIVLIILSTTEICNRVFLKQSIAIMAYEGARIAIVPDATIADIEMQVDEVAMGRAIRDVSVEVSPSDLSSVAEGEFITVTVRASGAQTASGRLFPSAETSKSVSMMKEN